MRRGASVKGARMATMQAIKTDKKASAAQEQCECCCRMKDTPRSDELKQNVTRRVNRAIGQLNGIKQMVDENRYCGEVLTQLAAVESAIRAISREVMADHMESCVIEQVQAGNTEVVSELMQLLRKFL